MSSNQPEKSSFCHHPVFTSFVNPSSLGQFYQKSDVARASTIDARIMDNSHNLYNFFLPYIDGNGAAVPLSNFLDILLFFSGYVIAGPVIVGDNNITLGKGYHKRCLRSVDNKFFYKGVVMS